MHASSSTLQGQVFTLRCSLVLRHRTAGATVDCAIEIPAKRGVEGAVYARWASQVSGESQ